MLPTRTSTIAVAVLAALALLLAAFPATSAADDTPPPPAPTAPCDAVSPIAIPCVALGKTFDAVAAECRRIGLPDQLCVLPLAHQVTRAARDAYLRSWVHRTAQFQSTLGDPLPLVDAQWVGTHNSANSLADSFTLSQADSNQQLSLTQQLDIDVRSLELDLHYVPRLELLGRPGVTVCHGQGPEQGDLGCTVEPLLKNVLPKIAGWLNAPEHAEEVLLIYLEDKLGSPAAYASTVETLDRVLRRPDGSALVHRPDPADRAGNGCTPLPLDLSRDDVRASGARVVLVGSCAPGWSTRVFDWDAGHVEGGSTSGYQSPPGCDATYGEEVYDTRLVRYFEDTTLVSALADPTRPPADPEALTPEKVRAMTDCGVNLFGFDQLLPEDGRLQSMLWSWAPDEPRPAAGDCTVQRGADGRWAAAPCTDLHPAACLADGTWTVTGTPVSFADAAAACAATGSTFELPRAGDQNARLRTAAGRAGADVWVRYSTAG